VIEWRKDGAGESYDDAEKEGNFHHDAGETEAIIETAKLQRDEVKR